MSGKNFVELPLSPLEHQSFMHCARGLGMEVKIIDGKYQVVYNDISDLYELGRQIERMPKRSPYSDRLALPMKKDIPK